LKDFLASRLNGLPGFELVFVELTGQLIKCGFGFFDAVFQGFAFSFEQGLIIEDNHPEGIGFTFVFNGQRDFKTAVEAAFVWQQKLVIMMVNGIVKSGFIGFIHGQWGKEKAVMIVDVGQVFTAGELGVADIKKRPVFQEVDQMQPLFNIGGDIGSVAAVGLLEQGKGAVGAHG
jgi:hypothetical protein